jgi:hypothetical protein
MILIKSSSYAIFAWAASLFLPRFARGSSLTRQSRTTDCGIVKKSTEFLRVVNQADDG